MNKFYSVFVLCAVVLVVFASIVNCAPAVEESEVEHIRVRRFTCDVLSAEAHGVKLNDAACGVHCLFRGRSGGYCNGQRVCVCR